MPAPVSQLALCPLQTHGPSRSPSTPSSSPPSVALKGQRSDAGRIQRSNSSVLPCPSSKSHGKHPELSLKAHIPTPEPVTGPQCTGHGGGLNLGVFPILWAVELDSIFNSPLGPQARSSAINMSKYKLIMLRHGEGAWNKENRFCSWVDQKLNSDGLQEARNCGKQLKALNFEFDLVFTSILNRSIHTAWLILEELGQEWVPVESSWRLNERHYGALISLNREQMALNHGEEQVRLWRRSYNVTPPPIEESHPYYHEIYNDQKYKVCDVPLDQLPRSESLKDVLERLLPYWNERIAPEVLRGKTVLISAHGNSCRALLKYLEGISDEEIINITLPTGVPILLELDENLHTVGPHQFLGDQEAIQAAIKKVDDQGKVKRADK
ncbi:hypothetical protein M91_16189 [Bos mutus]|uniref:Phosphoglycerate mutase n=2 Tax=Bos mutus TaxID=72004 RepID=L8I1X0_9CETA|nr:hypothetical protein M91_16189 [Bos mutus]